MKCCNVCKKPKIKILNWNNDKCIEKEICINPFCKEYNSKINDFIHKK